MTLKNRTFSNNTIIIAHICTLFQSINFTLSYYYSIDES